MLIRIFSRWNCSRTVLITCSLMTILLFIPMAASAQVPAEEGTVEESVEGTVEEPDQVPAGTTIDQEESPVTPGMETGTEMEKTSWLGFLAKGGLTMVPIVLCSIGFIAIKISLYLIIGKSHAGIDNCIENP